MAKLTIVNNTRWNAKELRKIFALCASEVRRTDGHRWKRRFSDVKSAKEAVTKFIEEHTEIHPPKEVTK